MNRYSWLAMLWALAVAALAVSWAARWRKDPGFETNLLALLPEVEKDPAARRALDGLVAAGSQHLAFLIRGPNLEAAGQAADALAASLKGQPGIAGVVSKLDKDPSSLALDFYRPWRYQLLTQSQRRRLTDSAPRSLAGEAYGRLLSPLGPPRLLPLEDDPLGLFSERLLDGASQGALSVANSRLVAQGSDHEWVVVLVELSSEAAVAASQDSLSAALTRAREAALNAGAAEVLRSGFFFHAAQASARARREMTLIGLGSTLGIIALMLLVFRTLTPMLLVMVSIAVGCVCALAVTQLLFTKIHVITLVFGTSVVGVAVDYGLLYFSGLYDSGRPWDARARLRRTFLSLTLAFVTTWLAYLLPAVLPFPALRQMGVFALAGLSAAWISSVLWLPPLSRSMSASKPGRLAAAMLAAGSRWPRWGGSRRLGWTVAALLVVSLAGLARLKSDDDVRQLYASSPALVAEEERAQTILGLSPGGQFLLLQAPDAQALLRLEESLAPELDGLRLRGRLGGWQGLSQFVPSAARQSQDKALLAKSVYAPGAALDELTKLARAPELAAAARREWKASPSDNLTPERWLASEISEPFRYLWLGGEGTGRASVISLSAVVDPHELAAFARPGVLYVDDLLEISALIRRYRRVIGWLLPAGYALAALSLYPILGTRTWRALAPALVGSIAALGLSGWLGHPLNLFGLVAQVLVLAMGVDYGIFIQGLGRGDDGATFLGITLAAISTLLSFGLLAFSSTPALADFGLAVSAGIGVSWLLAPCFA